MPSVISGDANVSATEFGFLDGVTSGLQSQINSKLNLAGGKILQIVRATDSTSRSTTSTVLVDASLSVTITPQKEDSAILLLHSCRVVPANGSYLLTAITDSSDNIVNASSRQAAGSSANAHDASIFYMAYATPATTSAVTYKVRFSVTPANSGAIRNDLYTGQLYAIEVSA